MDANKIAKSEVVANFSHLRDYYYKSRLPFDLPLNMILDDLCCIDHGNKYINCQVSNTSALIIHLHSKSREKVTIFTAAQSLAIMLKGNIVFKNRLPRRIKEVILMPFCESSHWHLCIANFTRFEFTLINPFGNLNSSKQNKCLSKFKIFFEEKKF